MAQPEKTPYGDIGLKIPYIDPGPGNEWSEDDRIQKDGFLLVKIFQRNVFLVQSIGTGKLYVNKLLRKGSPRARPGGRPGGSYEGARPPEIKTSTVATGMTGMDGGNLALDDGNGDSGADSDDDDGDGGGDDGDGSDGSDGSGGDDDDDADSDSPSEYSPEDDDYNDNLWEQMAEPRIRGGDGGEDDGGEDDGGEDDGGEDGEEEFDPDPDNNNDFSVTLPREPYFPHIVHWQRLGDGDNEVWSLYYKYCNGGTLDDFQKLYMKKNQRVPEHFIWRVAEQLGEALAWMYYGRPRGADATANTPNWRRAFHRDFFMNNMFVHYPGPQRGPKQNGERGNAFPDIVAGDFGESHIEGDPYRFTRWGTYQEWPIEPWQDIATLSEALRTLAVTHFDAEEDRAEINDWSVRVINDLDDLPGPLYSDELIDMLEALEWKRGPGDVDMISEQRPDGTHGYDDLPDMDWVVDVMLPQARVQVARRSSELPPDTDYRSLDVSWTKPSRLMPYLCDHATPLGVTRLNGALYQLDRWRDVRNPPYQFQRLVFGAPTPAAMGYGVVSARLAAPVFTGDEFYGSDDQWDNRVHAQQPYPQEVRRGFQRTAEALVAGLRRLEEHETRRLDADQAPSGSDRGSAGGRGPGTPPLTGHRSAHPHLAAVQRRIDELEAALLAYKAVRDGLRDQGRGSPRPPSSSSSSEEEDDGDDDGGDVDGDDDGEEGMDVDNDADDEDNGEGPSKRQKTQ